MSPHPVTWRSGESWLEAERAEAEAYRTSPRCSHCGYPLARFDHAACAKHRAERVRPVVALVPCVVPGCGRLAVPPATRCAGCLSAVNPAPDLFRLPNVDLFDGGAR